MKKLASKFHRFVHDEDGMEFIQVAVIVLGVMVLVAAAWAIYNRVNEEMGKVPDKINLGG